MALKERNIGGRWSKYKLPFVSKYQECNVQYDDCREYHCVIYRKHKGVDPKISHDKKIGFYFLLFLSCLHEIMDVSLIYCSNPFTVQVNQVTILYTLSFYSDYKISKTGEKSSIKLNKTGKRKALKKDGIVMEQRTQKKGKENAVYIYLV